MTRLLMIRADEKAAIKAAIERARAKPITPEQVQKLAISNQMATKVTLADRRPEHERPPSEYVAIPYGYFLAISFEQQPAGLCLHLSMSVEVKNKLPNPAAIALMTDECLAVLGIGSIRDVAPKGGHTWIEEFAIDGQPGGLAFNVLYLVDPVTVGDA
jgi:hypothetical protein